MVVPGALEGGRGRGNGPTHPAPAAAAAAALQARRSGVPNSALP